MIRYNKQDYIPLTEETVLDCLDRNGITLPHSCKSGVCHTCLMKAVNGKPTVESQKGLKDTLVLQNYFLACSCIPQEKLEIVLPESEKFQCKSRILDRTYLSTDILRLRLALPDNFTYHPGQYVSIFKNELTSRTFSIASLPATDSFLEFHIRIIKQGILSGWLTSKATETDTLMISRANGSCFYTPGAPMQPLVLVGSGTGLAPLYGIVRDALSAGHKSEIRLYHGVRNEADLYLHSEITELADKFPNLIYVPCVSGPNNFQSSSIRQGRSSDIMLRELTNLKNSRIYLCGNADMVNATKQAAFLAGASLQNIYADPFIHS